MASRKLILITGVILLLAAAMATLGTGGFPALASPLAQTGSTPQPTATPIPNLSISDDYCISCHGQPGFSMELQSGEELGLYVPPELYFDSIHGELGYACVQCHTDVGQYPHPEFNPEDARAATLQLNQACGRCHEQQFEQTQDSVHAAALAAGNRNAAVCSDCHTAHAVQRLTDPETGDLLPSSRVWVPQTCARCHYAIYQKYQESVHGAALLEEGNTDVPTCIDCHGVHNIENPTTAAFRLRSPEICAGCHTDPEIMDKYGLSTQVLDTYVADFHGTTVTLFEREHPDQQTNKPVCYDCHGVHDIASTSDPEKGLQVRQNILARCQVCHPDATANFPDAWLSHYIPSPDRYPLVFTVDFFYSLFIPGVLGGMAILVVMDMAAVVRNYINNRRKREHLPEEGTATEEAQPAEIPTETTGPLEAKAPAVPPVDEPSAETQTPSEQPEESLEERGEEDQDENQNEDEESAHG